VGNNTFMRNGVGELCRKADTQLTANFDDNIKHDNMITCSLEFRWGMLATDKQ